MTRNEIIDEARRFGWWKTAQDLGLRALNRMTTVRILKGVTVDTVATEYLKCNNSYEAMFLDEAQLSELVRNRPEYEITDRFLREAFAKGDECYGIVDGSSLATYGWY